MCHINEQHSLTIIIINSVSSPKRCCFHDSSPILYLGFPSRLHGKHSKMSLRIFFATTEHQTMSSLLTTCFKHTQPSSATCRCRLITCIHTWTSSLRDIVKSVTNTVERLHQDITMMEKRYQGNYWSTSMLVYHCWTLK